MNLKSPPAHTPTELRRVCGWLPTIGVRTSTVQYLYFTLSKSRSAETFYKVSGSALCTYAERGVQKLCLS